MQLLSEMSTACEAIADIVRDLAVYARSSSQEASERVVLPDLIDKVVRLVGRDLQRRAVIERDYDPAVPAVFVPRTRLTQVLTNLLVNAGHAIAEVERDVHRVRISLRADDDTILISVSDTGPGIEASVIERIFDPFFTTKRNGNGTGLGLSISRSIMQDLGGDLIVESVHGEGATFVAWLPTPDIAQLPEPRARPQALRPLRLMIIESDARVLSAVARFLHGRHELLLASDGQEAIELLASGSRPDVVVCEADAEDERGNALLDWLQGEHPALYARTIATVDRPELVARHECLAISKPIKPTLLMQTIEQVVTREDDARVG
jgi:anti-sigma regulatory factor (Ser/Thr protein kinase)